MDSETPQSLYHLLLSARLTTTQRRVAEFIVENPHQAPFMSSIELAKACDVSQPSVMRLANAMGFNRYRDFQERMRDIVIETNNRTGDKEPRRTRFQEVIDGEISNLADLGTLLHTDSTVRGAAEMLMTTPVLPVVGTRASSPVSTYFAYFAAKIRDRVFQVTSADSLGLESLHSAHLQGCTACLVILLPRYPREVSNALSFIKELGVRIVLVTDRPDSPGAPYADSQLIAPVRTQLQFDSQAAPLLMASILIDAMSTSQPQRVSERLEAFEAFVDRQRVFHNSRGRRSDARPL